MLFIDPKFDSTVPVYAVLSNGAISKKPITALVPGDIFHVKERRKSDGMYILKARDLNGNDIDLAIDPKTVQMSNGESALFFSAPDSRNTKVSGSSKSAALSSLDLDPSMCAMQADLCHSYSPGDDAQVEDAVLAMTLDPESTKPKWHNYYKTDKGFWLDSENTSRVDDSWSAFGETENCEKNPSSPMNDKDKNSLNELSKKAKDLGNEKQMDTILDHIGDCFPANKTGDYHKQVVDAVANKKMPSLYKEQRNSQGGIDAVPATKADLVAIDVMARTLYGEMANCFSKGTQYPESVAKVVLNRVDFNKEKPALGSRFVDSKARSEKRNDVTNVIFKDWQFSVWNREDSARRMAMCPPSNANKNFWNGNKPSALEQNIWKEAVRISSEAVLSGESFRKRTKDLKALYYTSNFELPQQHYKPITNAKIDGKAVPLSRCVQLWSAKDLKKWAPEHGHLFHPLFLEALLSVAAN